MSSINTGALALFMILTGAMLFTSFEVTTPMLVAGAFLLICTLIITREQDEFF